MPKRPVARVLPDSRLPQLDRLFDYAIPDGMDVEPGIRVKVPMGRGARLQAGFVVEVASESEFTGILQPIDSMVSPVVVLTHELLALAQEVAARGAGGVSDVLRLAIPARAVRVENAWRERDMVTPVLPDSPEAPDIYPSEGWHALAAHGSRHWWQLPYGVAPVAGVSVPRSYVEIARLAQSVLASGRSVVVCLPDWRDQELMGAALEAVVSRENLAAFDASHTPSTRYQHYLRCLDDRPVIVYGSRHSIYAPVSNLGAVIVVTDGDDSHRERLAPYPHSRDVALLRGEQSGAAVVFAGLSPSIEVIRLIEMGYLSELAPTIDSRPRVIPTALGTQSPAPTSPARLPSVAYRAVSQAVENGPVLVQVFHSGFAPGLVCGDCGERARCLECGGPLRSGEPGRAVSCGWCGHLAAAWRCTSCKSSSFRPSGHGIGRTSTELGKAFPGVPVIRADGDHPVLRVGSKPAVVVATRGAEPVAEGGYHAALLLDGDAMLQRPALDALEDTITAWEWAMSLLRPGAIAYLTDLDGRVAQAFASGAVRQLLSRELRDRQALRMPPAVRIASVTGASTRVAEILQRWDSVDGVDTLGPLPLSSGAVRGIVRMPYRLAREVADDLRAAVVKQATGSSPRGERQGRLKVAMDDVGALDEFALGPQ